MPRVLLLKHRVAGLSLAILIPATVGHAQALADRQIAARPDGSLYNVLHPLERSTAMAHNAAWLAAGARVPIGFEYVAERFLTTYPAPGISRKPIIATGRTLGDVLNELVALDPRYGWSETDGVILIRPKGMQAEDPNALLRQRLSKIDLRGAGVEEVLAMYRERFGKASNPTHRIARDPWWDTIVSLRLTAPTVLELLNAVVKAHGDAIWVLSYFGPPATYERSRLEFIKSGGQTGNGYEARPWPPIPPRGIPPLPSPLKYLRPITPAGALGAAQQIALANHMPTGVEMPIERTGERPMIGSGAALDLTGLSPEAAFDALRQEQPGFEWTTFGSVVRMYPTSSRPGTGGPLDRVVDRFDLNRASLGKAHNDVAGLFDRSRWAIRMPSAPAPPRMALFAETLPVFSTAFEEPRITLSLKAVTIRDILDRIVAAHGEAGWTVDYRQAAGGDATMSISMRTFDNTSRGITVRYVHTR
jgi:hypothetical protein